MTRLLGSLLALCFIAAACGSADTAAPAPEPAATPTAVEAPATEPAGATTTTEAPAEDPEPIDDPAAGEAGNTATPPEPETETGEEADTTTTVPETIEDAATEETDATTTTTTTTPEPAPEPDTTEDPATEEGDTPTTTTTPEPEADPETIEDPASEEADTTTTTIPDPVAGRLAADPDAPARDWVDGVNTAGWDFHRRLAGNAVSSPMSIGVAFSLARAGASPDSGAALDQIFGFPGDGTHSAANAVDLSLAEASVEPTTLEVANRLFPDDDFTMRTEFQRTAANQYGAVIEPVDTADGAAAAGVINRWVSESTRGLIPMIVNGDTVQNAQLVLVNTVYLKADWVAPFPHELTADGQFTTGDGQTVTVPFMRDQRPAERRFVRLEGADAVELPYQGGQLAMWLVVPHDPAGLVAVEESLGAQGLTGLQGASQTGMVDITMPKWEQTLPPADLFGWLCPQGFCPGARFDGIAPGIFLTAALHSAKVIVDEKGTEAAAATALVGRTSLPPPPDLTIVADRPFLWAIVHQDTGALLFVGRLVDPTA